MKKTVKIISIITVVSLLLCMSVFFASAKTITYIKGDADGDGTISVLDATTIQKTLASLIMDTDGMITIRGEVGGDTLDITDATYIQKYLAHIDTAVKDINTEVSIEIEDPTEPATEPATEAPTQDSTYPYDEYELPFIPSR
ncbi:MAG: dockerin type I repeat-containing protein [Ruminococcus sp.]|nr:dockerin type I repeat-containing protein [Ruminococcus sp.]